MAKSKAITDADILDRVVSRGAADLPPDVARAYLDLAFDATATKHISQLLRKNNRGAISADERLTLEKYLRVGKFLDLLQAKAKLALKNNGKPA